MTDIMQGINENIAGNQENFMNAATSRMRGTAGKQMAQFESKQMMDVAKAIEAAGIRESADMRLRGDVMLSNAKARAAASGAGGGASNIEYEAKLKENADYNAAAAVYQSKEQANVVRAKAGARWLEGDIMEREGKLASYQITQIR